MMPHMRGLHLIQTETATGEAASLLTAVQRALGLTPNLARAMASSPAALRGYLDFSGALRRGSLPAAVRERIALLVAQEHRCDYGLSAHTFLATKRGALTEGEAACARQGAAEDATGAAALCFAAALLRGHGDVTNDELATARDAGLTDGQLVEIVANVALGVFTDYLTKAGRVAVDWPLVRHTDQAPTP